MQHGEHAARRGREHEEDRGHEERESTWGIEKCRGRRHAAAAAHSRLVSDMARREKEFCFMGPHASLLLEETFILVDHLRHIVSHRDAEERRKVLLGAHAFKSAINKQHAASVERARRDCAQHTMFSVLAERQAEQKELLARWDGLKQLEADVAEARGEAELVLIDVDEALRAEKKRFATAASVASEAASAAIAEATRSYKDAVRGQKALVSSAAQKAELCQTLRKVMS